MTLTGVSRSEIERTLYRNLVEIASLAGYHVNTVGKTKPDVLTERQAIKAAGREIIDLYSIGTTQQRGWKGNNGIFINLRQFNAGSVAHWELPVVVPDPNDPTLFNQVNITEGQRSLLYDVRSVASSAEYDRICGEIIYAGLCQTFVNKHLPVVVDEIGTRDPERIIRISFSGSQEIKSANFIERLYTFTIQDVWLKGEIFDFGRTVTQTGIVPLTTVCANKVDENGNTETELLD